MGGKAKQAQRTKGNLRPASSSKASLQLDNVSFMPMDVNFTTSIVSGFSEDLMDVDASVDQCFRMVLRKMTKKDPTTKIKALKEFTELVNQSEVDVVKTALSFFPKAYVLLSTDVDARVRESAQSALFAVVNKVGKHLATILKPVFPAWVCGQYDTHPTAASVATNCFEKAFPAKKVSDVFAYCEIETLDYFIKNLTVLNSQTVCNPKSYTPEECEAKYQRVVISSLRGYALYLEKIAPEKLVESASKNLVLIDNDRFWSLHKNKVPQIRSAFFEALSALLQYGAFLLDKFQEQVTSNVFKSIDESDPALLSHIWTCIILVQLKIETWSKYINLSKMLLPKLWKILRTALYPCVIYPNLLPLISKFNKAMLPEDQLHKFYLRFFEEINYGLRNVQMGKSETSAVASAYYEILKYITMQVASDKDVSDDDKFKLSCSLLDDHVIAVIFWCINTEGSFGKHIFHHIANLINYWSKNSQSVALYQRLLTRFWSELYQILTNSLDTSTNIERITSSHVELVKNLRNYSLNQKVKGTKIKFEDSVDSASSTFSDSGLLKDSGNNAFAQQLNELVYKLCNIYTSRISSTQEIEFVENYEILVKEYQSEELFRSLAKWKNPDEVNICSLYDTYSAWLLEDGLRCESIIEIILVLYKYLKPCEKIDLLNRWIRVPSVQSWIILRALSYPLCMEPDITKLLKMNEVTDHLVECARQASNGVYKENLIILQKCFFQTEDGNILIDAKTCERIVDMMCQPLIDESRINQMDQCASFLAQILPVICSDTNKKQLQQKIFLSLFEFSIMKELSDDLSEDTLWEVTTAWQDALSSDDVTMDDFLLGACSKIIAERTENFSIDKMTVDGMERFTEIVAKLIICSTEQEDAGQRSSFVEKLTNQLLIKKTQNDTYIENLSLCIDSMQGAIVLKSIDDVPNQTDFMDSLDTYLKNKVFNLEVIIKLSCNIKKTNRMEAVRIRDEDDMEPGEEIEFSEMRNQQQEEEITEDYCDMDENLLKEWTEGIFEKFFEVCYGGTVLNILLMNSKGLRAEHETWIIYMQERLAILMKQFPDHSSIKMKEKFFSIVSTRDGLWAKCLMNLINTKSYSADNSGSILLYEDSLTNAIDGETMISYVNILQTFSELIEKKGLPVTTNLFENYPNLLVKVSASRSLIRNHLNVGDFNELSDRKIVGNALIVMNEVLTKQKAEPYLLYNKDVSLEEQENVLLVTEIAHFVSDILTYFPNEVDVKRWDFIRIALSSWVLSVSKSCEKFNDNKVKAFICAIFKLNAAMFKFITIEKTKSSTQMLQEIIDEWEKIFAREVNLVLIKSFIHIIRNLDYDSKHQEFFVDTLCPFVGSIDFSYTLQSQKVDHTFSLKDLIVFALENLSNKCRGVCVTSATILKQLTRGLIKFDQDVLIQRNSEDDTGKNDDGEIMENNRWHILDTFRETLENYQDVIRDYIEDFNFKLNEMDDLSSISPNIAFSYLLLWDCILNFCSKAPAELRSIYARWITAHQFEEVFLVSLFKLMPRDIIKNPDASVKSGHIAFLSLEWKEIEGSQIDNDRYAAFLYAESLKTVPAVVRRWWHASSPRKAQLVERVTQNYVTPILCQQDLTALTSRKDKDGKDNMHIRVLMQSREVFATYSLEEAKMELTISLPPNYPLGAIKIDSTKHIAGKLQAREIVKQLSIYLTHQNGRLYDGIFLWKRNLDRKYEGVEECYVCYSVINQETCQLPRLSCKTCKKKFHSNCLYKWFQSSNKSTCPLCRNVF